MVITSFQEPEARSGGRGFCCGSNIPKFPEEAMSEHESCLRSFTESSFWLRQHRSDGPPFSQQPENGLNAEMENYSRLAASRGNLAARSRSPRKQ